MRATVIDVLHANSLVIQETWRHQGEKGCLIAFRGFNPPQISEPGGLCAKYRVLLLLMGSQIEIRQMHEVSGDHLICDAWFRGKPVPHYFPQYLNGSSPKGVTL